MSIPELTSSGGRLKFLISCLNYSHIEFALAVGLTKYEISRLINNKKQLNIKIINKIKLKFPNVNTAWLEHNIGNSGIENEVRLLKESHYIEKIANLEAEIERLKIENYNLKRNQ